MTELTIIHVDMDAFFAAVEQRDDPNLMGKPVIIGGYPYERGVVSTCSYEARHYGVRSAMPLGEAYRRCPHGIFMHGDHRKYGMVSQQIQAIFAHYTPMVEPISIDEAFLDVSGCERLFGPAVEIGRQIKERIRHELKLTASVGVSYNKYLAKLASDYGKPDGFLVITAQEARGFLAPLPITRLWGVGTKTANHLERFGIRTIGQLAAFPLAELRAHLGVVAHQLHLLAQGIDHRRVESPQDAKSIGHEHTFGEDTYNHQQVLTVLLDLSAKVARRLRLAGVTGRTITLKLRYGDFSTITRSYSSPDPTDYDQDLFRVGKELLLSNLTTGKPVRLIGISVSHLIPADCSPHQLSLFPEPKDDHRRDRLMQAMDAIKDRFGEGSISWARVTLDEPDDDPQGDS